MYVNLVIFVPRERFRVKKAKASLGTVRGEQKIKWQLTVNSKAR
jgi:hypothetical protein